MPSPCALRSCPLSGTIANDAARVETKAFLPQKLRLDPQLRVAWSPDGNAVFHRPCWDQLLAECEAPDDQPLRKRRRQEVPAAAALRAEAEKVREAAEVAELHDSPESVAAAAVKVAALVRSARHCVFFTGAGVSTAAGIGDYRGKDGKWTELDRQEEACAPPPDEDGVPYEELRPTLSHEVISALIESGRAQFVISQNCDDLHGLSGVPAARLAELHGNVFVERCEACQRRYRREHYVLDDAASEFFELGARARAKLKKEEHWKQCRTCSLCHRTGRRCEDGNCGQPLIDTIINFGDDLEENVIASAEEEAATADLVICLGSTISVTPASYIVRDCCRRKKCHVVICNRQRTDFDSEAAVRVFGDCDPLSTAVLRELMGAESFSDWRGARAARMQRYDAVRAGK